MRPPPAGLGRPARRAASRRCSFGIASLGSAVLFVWLMLLGNQVHKKLKPALGINGLVTGIAA